MHSQQTSRTDPSVKLMQDTGHKVPIELIGETEKKLKEMCNLNVTISDTRPTEWTSSITYPKSLQICLAPKDLTKASLH